MTADNQTAEAGLRALRERIAREERLIVAFSGGADSALLAWAASDVLGAAALAVTAVSASLPAAERAAAARFCRAHSIRHLQVCTDELDRPDYRRNGADRCFHCKSALFDAVAPVAELLGTAVALGTNLDDLGDHRPGLRAAAGRGAIAPLVDAGLTKQQVRNISSMLGLETAGKPAAACLSSRIAYGDPVTEDLLGRIEAAESVLHKLGFPSCRVRAHANGTVARVEVPGDRLEDALRLRDAIAGGVREAGFAFCALDLGGLRSGSMNTLLRIEPAGTS